MLFPKSFAALMLIVGAVWIVQGFGIIRTGSFMDGNALWGWIGLPLALGGAALLALRR